MWTSIPYEIQDFVLKEYPLAEDMFQNLQNELDFLISDALDSNLIDEFSDGSFLDILIHCRCNQIRNGLIRMQERRKDYLSSIQKVAENEINCYQKKIAIVESEIKRLMG